MARCCPLPGCEVLCITSAPICTRHWGQVSESTREAFVKAEKSVEAARDGRQLMAAQLERSRAWDAVVLEATRPPIKNMGRTGSTYPSRPTLV